MSKPFTRDVFKAPNLLSISRILLIPFFVYFFDRGGRYVYYSLVVLALSFATDVLDGWVARKFNLKTDLGLILDPTADKLTQLAIMYMLYRDGYVTLLMFLILLGKESILVIGAIYLKKGIHTNMIPSNKWGKMATFCFYVSCALILKPDTYHLGVYAFYVTLLIMLIALVTYSREAWGLRTDAKQEKAEKT